MCSQVRERVDDAFEDRPPLLIGPEHLRAGVAEREVELLALPPRVERHARRADRRAGPEQHDPLDVVRRDDGHAVAGTDAELEKLGRGPADLRVVLGEGESTVALHHPVDVVARVGRGDEVAHRADPLAVHLQRDAEHLLDDDLERAAGARQLLERARSRHEVGASSCCTTSNDQSSACVLTGSVGVVPR